MGFMRLVLYTLSATTAFVSFLAPRIFKDDPAPDIKDEFWGPGSKPGMTYNSYGTQGLEDDLIYSFKVDFTSPHIIQELRSKLRAELDSGFAPPLEGVGFSYGFNSDYLREVLSYWLNNYDFAARERYLNRYPHFKTKIGGLDIHFQHIKPQGYSSYKATAAVIFCHGWPGSFVEYQKLVEYFLTPENSDMNFEIVIPSLPGAGYSQGASRPGMNTVRIANIYGRLMKRLGYEKYYTLGEDWGSGVSTDMAVLYPKNVLGTHFSCVSFHPYDQLKQFVQAQAYLSTTFPNKRTQERFFPVSKMLLYYLRETGYFHFQGTKPDTIGVGLTHSPSGLAAYILEKFSTWTNESYIRNYDGGLTHKFTLDQLLDNLMVYWTSKCITSSMRIYSESFLDWFTWRVPVTTPTACANLPEDIFFTARVGLTSKYPNMKQYSTPDEGGHFAAFEVPHIVAKEALTFFNNVQFGKYK